MLYYTMTKHTALMTNPMVQKTEFKCLLHKGGCMKADIFRQWPAFWLSFCVLHTYIQTYKQIFIHTYTYIQWQTVKGGLREQSWELFEELSCWSLHQL